MVAVVVVIAAVLVVIVLVITFPFLLSLSSSQSGASGQHREAGPQLEPALVGWLWRIQRPLSAQTALPTQQQTVCGAARESGSVAWLRGM